MYSRYVPNQSGGYDRRLVPDAPPPEPGPAGPEVPSAGSGIPNGPPRRSAPPAGVETPGQIFPSAGKAPSRPPSFSPRPPPLWPPGGLPVFGGPLDRLLPRGLDTEELLILAVLLLAMKQDGAENAELLIAAALYLLL